jgi:phosphoenolpyruvate synthase/pyruvate phosphate dikinase
MSSFVLGFQDIDKTKLTVVGGKGANLGELSRIEGILVLDGFCISTIAFQRIIEETPSIHELLDQLSLLKVDDRDKIGELSGEIRRVIEGIAIPEDIQEEVICLLSKLGENDAYAVRSSATAEDLPTASFAGQQDTTHAPMHTAGGRLFVDVTAMLASPVSRETILNVTLGKSDPLLKDALTTIIERGDFIKSLPDDQSPAKSSKGRSPADFQTLNDYDPAIVAELIQQSQTSIEALKQTIQTKSGVDLLDFILEDIQQLKKTNADSQSFGVLMTGMNASSWVNEKMNEWLGEKNAADTISQSAPNNIRLYWK